MMSQAPFGNDVARAYAKILGAGFLLPRGTLGMRDAGELEVGEGFVGFEDRFNELAGFSVFGRNGGNRRPLQDRLGRVDQIAPERPESVVKAYVERAVLENLGQFADDGSFQSERPSMNEIDEFVEPHGRSPGLHLDRGIGDGKRAVHVGLRSGLIAR